MRIAIVRRNYLVYGGAERFSQAFLTSLARAGHEVCIFANRWDVAPEAGIAFVKVPVWGPFSAIKVVSFALFAYWRLRRDHFDIIQSHERTLYQDVYRAGDGCHRAWLGVRLKRVGWFKRLQIVTNPYHWGVLFLEWLLLAGRRYKKIIAISQRGREEMRRYYGVPDADVEVIYNGVDLTRFHPDNRQRFRQEVRRQYGLAPDAVVFLFVGSDFERKGLPYLLEALAQVQDARVRLLVAGKGGVGRYLKRCQDEAVAQRLCLAGVTPTIERLYAASDYLILPTLYEPFGNVHLEAMASGLPVITSRCSGGAELVEEGENGWLIDDPMDPADIAACMRRALQEGNHEAMGRQARRTAERFSQERHLHQVLELYRGLAKTGDQDCLPGKGDR